MARNVLVFHSDADVRRWIADALHSSRGRFSVLADTGSMQETLVLARFHQPHVIVLGFQESPDMTDFLFGLRAATPNARLIGYLDEGEDPPAVVPGYDAFVTHKRKTPKLLEALERAANHGGTNT